MNKIRRLDRAARFAFACLAPLFGAAVRGQDGTVQPPVSEFVAETVADELAEIVATFPDTPTAADFARASALAVARRPSDAPTAAALSAAWRRFAEADDEPTSVVEHGLVRLRPAATATRPPFAVAGGFDGRVVLRRDGASVRRESAHDGAVFFAALGADGATWTAGADGTLRLRSAPPVRRTFVEEHTADVRAVATDAVGSRFATVGVDGRALVRDRRGGPARELPSPEEGPLSGVAFYAPGADADLVVAHVFGLVVWYRAAGAAHEIMGVARLPSKINGLAVRPGARGAEAFVACGDGAIRRVGADGRAEVLVRHGSEAKGVSFDAAGRRLLSVAGDDTLRIATLDAAGAVVGREAFGGAGRGGHWHAAAFDAEGSRIAAGALSGVALVRAAEDADGAASRAARTWRAHRGSVEALAWSAGVRRLFTAAADGRLLAWDFDGEGPRAEPALDVRASSLTLYGIAFAAEGRALVVAGQDGAVRTFAAETLAPLAVASAGPAARAIATTDDGRAIEVEFDDGVRRFALDPPRLVRHRPGLLRAADRATGAPPPDARTLVERHGPFAAPEWPVRAYASHAAPDAGSSVAAFAEDGGVVRVVATEGVGDAAETTVHEFRLFADGAWAVVTSRRTARGAEPARLVRADDGSRTGLPLPAARAAEGDEAASALEVAPPPPLALAPGEGARVEIEATNTGLRPILAVRLAESLDGDVALFPLGGGWSRLEPGETLKIPAWAERRRSAPGAETRPMAQLVPLRVYGHGGATATAGLLVR